MLTHQVIFRLRSRSFFRKRPTIAWLPEGGTLHRNAAPASAGSAWVAR
jgi:hypothetical protein